MYPDIVRRGLHIVTPNKKAFSGSIALFRDLNELSKKNHVFVKHESSVGAGLPILSTLMDLIASGLLFLKIGDEIIEIDGIFSGTLSYIFNNFSKEGESVSFSSIVEVAKQKGYTEPDPREDLNGMDVGRKVLFII